MRILRLDLGASKKRVEMHPLLTVVQRLESADRTDLLQHIRSLARGSAVGVRGLIEDQSNLLVLEGQGTIALSHVTTVNVVVDADDPDICAAASGSLQAEIDQLQRQADIDAALVEETRAQLEPTVKWRLAKLRRELHASITGKDTSLGRRSSVEAALQRASEVEQYNRSTPDGAQDAISAWAAYQAFLSEHQEHLSNLSEELSAAEKQVALREAAAAEAETAATPVLLTSEEESRLYDLEEMRQKKNWRPDLPEARELQTLLDKVGVKSWTAYSVHRLSPDAPSEKRQLLEHRRAVLEQDRCQSAEVRKRLDTDPIVSELEVLRSEATSLAAQLFGPDKGVPADIGAGLAELEERRSNPKWLSAQKQLLDVIKAPEIGASEDTDAESAQAWAQEWLDNNNGSQNRQRRNEEVRLEIVKAETVLRRHSRALKQIERLEQRAAHSNNQIRKIFEARETAEAQGAHHTAELLSYLRSVSEEGLWEAARAIPVAITGALDTVDVPEFMASLELLSQRVQVVVVSENPAIAAWAETATEKKALLSGPTSAQIGSP